MPTPLDELAIPIAPLAENHLGAPIAHPETLKYQEYPASPAACGPPEESFAKPRVIPPIVLQEVVAWAVNREKPTDLVEQEEVLAVLFWYLPEETMYQEVRERWGWGVRDVQEICDRPSFYVAMGKAMKPLLLKSYTKIMLVMADRAERGHLGAANFLFTETGMKREQRIEEAEKENLEAVVAKLIKAVQDVLPDQLLNQLHVKTTPGFVPHAVLPKSFDALPEAARRERLVKTKVYQRRTKSKRRG